MAIHGCDTPTLPAEDFGGLKIDWTRAAPNPVALVLSDWSPAGLPGGTAVAHRDADGCLYGCRTISAGGMHDRTLGAWILTDVARRGLELQDYRAASANRRPRGFDDREPAPFYERGPTP